MQFWISLPKGWHPGGSWPVVVALEAAEKQYQANAERFMKARGDRPFIVVVPYIVTNGNQGLRDPEIFPYTLETWDTIDRITGCRFDAEGLAQVLADVQRLYQGRDRCYLTGFEAGTHLLWAYTFQHPEQLAAVAPVAGNYRGRCVTAEIFSGHAARATLPIRCFTGSLDHGFGPGGPIYAQYLEAAAVARNHGFLALSEQAVPGKDHVPLPAEVLAWFASLESPSPAHAGRIGR
jgi:poly(3-hydroxybutyrate) depolymerase